MSELWIIGTFRSTDCCKNQNRIVWPRARIFRKLSNLSHEIPHHRISSYIDSKYQKFAHVSLYFTFLGFVFVKHGIINFSQIFQLTFEISSG